MIAAVRAHLPAVLPTTALMLGLVGLLAPSLAAAVAGLLLTFGLLVVQVRPKLIAVVLICAVGVVLGLHGVPAPPAHHVQIIRVDR